MTQFQQSDGIPSAKIAEGIPLFPSISVNAIPYQLWDVLHSTFPKHRDLIAQVQRNIENTGSPMVNACAVLSLLTAASISARNLLEAPPEMAKLEELFQTHALQDWKSIRCQLEGRWTPEMASLVKLVYAIAEVLGDSHRSAASLSDRINELGVYLSHDVLPTSNAVREIIRKEVLAIIDPRVDKILETVNRREKPSRSFHPLVSVAIASGISAALSAFVVLAIVLPRITGLQRPATLDTVNLERRDDGYWAEQPGGTWKPIKLPLIDKRSKQATPPKANP